MRGLLRLFVFTGSALLVAGAVVLPGVPAVGSTRFGELWAARYDGPIAALDDANAVAVSPDGTRVFATGRSDGGASDMDYATVAYDATTGGSLWTSRYDGSGHGSDEALSVAVSPDGSKVYVTGDSWTTLSSYDYVTVAYDASTGTALWLRRYNGLGNLDDYGRSVAVSPDGSKVVVTGYSYGGAIGYDYETLGYDAVTGNLLWKRRLDGLNHKADYAYSVTVSPDSSSVYVTGYADMKGSGNDFVTLALDASTGGFLWSKAYNGPGNSTDYAYSVAASPDGTRVFVTGQSTGSSSGYDYATVAYDAATGSTLWVQRFNGPGNSTDVGEDVAVSPDGSKVFVTGYTYGSGTSYDYTVIAYDSDTGQVIWGRSYNGAGNSSDYSYAVAVAPDGSDVFVTGYAYSGASGNDYATVGFDADTGSSIWAKRYNGPGNGSDYGNDVAVAGSTVFVTGQSYGGSSDYDYATVAYGF